MLKELREHSSSWIIKGFMLLIASTFVLWGSGRISGCNEDVAAKVNGETISIANFRTIADRQLEVYREQMRLYFKKDLTPEDEEAHRKIIFNNLIDEIVLKHAAADLDIPTSTIETKETIRTLPYFRNQDGSFDYDRYLTIVRTYFRKTPEEFEQEQYEDIRLNRLEWIIKNSPLLESDEKEFEKNFKKDKIKLGFIAFDPKELKEKAPELREKLLATCTAKNRLKETQKVAKDFKLKIDDTDFFSRNPSGYIPKIGTNFEAMKTLFTLSKEKSCMNDIIEIEGKSYFIWLTDSKEEVPPEEDNTYFGKNYNEMRIKDGLFGSYKKSLVSRAKIKKYIYTDEKS